MISGVDLGPSGWLFLDEIFNGFSNLVLIKDDEIEISGSVLIEDQNSRIRGKIIKFNMGSGELQIN